MQTNDTYTLKEQAKEYVCNVAYALNIPVDTNGELIESRFHFLHHYEQKMKEFQEHLKELDEQGIERAVYAIEQERIYNEMQHHDRLKEMTKNQTLLAEITAWQTTSSRTSSLKQKVIERLQTTIENEQIYLDNYQANLFNVPSPEVWLQEEKESISKTLAFYQKEYDKQKANKQDIMQWVEDVQKDIKHL